MSKDINQSALNKVTISGKLLDSSFAKGTLSTGTPYERANLTIRVTQTYNGHEEISEIPVGVFSSPTTRAGKPNPAWESLQDLKKLKTVQDVGEAEADSVRITNASLRESSFISRSTGSLINSWQINASFVNQRSQIQDIATFNADIYILDMNDELDREGEPTGRLIIKGGIVQWQGKLDIVEFVVDQADQVDFIQRNWSVNDTVNVGGRIRVTSQEEVRPTHGWGEDLGETTTRRVRELVITRGSDSAYDEDFSYDMQDIKKSFNVRKANIEQMQLDAQKGTAKKSEVTTAGKYDWE